MLIVWIYVLKRDCTVLFNTNKMLFYICTWFELVSETMEVVLHLEWEVLKMRLYLSFYKSLFLILSAGNCTYGLTSWKNGLISRQFYSFEDCFLQCTSYIYTVLSYTANSKLEITFLSWNKRICTSYESVSENMSVCVK